MDCNCEETSDARDVLHTGITNARELYEKYEKNKKERIKYNS